MRSSAPKLDPLAAVDHRAPDLGFDVALRTRREIVRYFGFGALGLVSPLDGFGGVGGGLAFVGSGCHATQNTPSGTFPLGADVHN